MREPVLGYRVGLVCTAQESLGLGVWLFWSFRRVELWGR